MLARVDEARLEMMPVRTPGFWQKLGLWQRLAIWRQALRAAKDRRAIARRANDHLLKDIGLDRRDFPVERLSKFDRWY